jgi:phosphotransacetylase
MQSLMNSIATNPDISRQMVANNPKLYEQIIDTLPATMKEQMRNLDVQSLMKNDRVHKAIIQVQKGLKNKKKD